MSNFETGHCFNTMVCFFINNLNNKTMKTILITIIVLIIMGSCNNDRLSLENCRWIIADNTFYTVDMKYYDDTLINHELIKCISLHIETDTSYLRCIRYYTDSIHSYTTCQNWNVLIYETR